MKTQKILTIITFVFLGIAVLSLFTPIVNYKNRKGRSKSFALPDFLGGDSFDKFVSSEYKGKVIWDIDSKIITIFAILAVIALILAVIGIVNLSKQRMNIWPMILTVIGLLGTLAPSILILICIVVLKDNYRGTISCGIYPIVSPIATLLSIVVSSEMFRRNLKLKKYMRESAGLIRTAGELDDFGDTPAPVYETYAEPAYAKTAPEERVWLVCPSCGMHFAKSGYDRCFCPQCGKEFANY